MDEVGAWMQIVLLIELFAVFMCLDQVCKRPLTDNLLLLSHLPSFFSKDGLCLGTNQKVAKTK